jgi:lysophospholipase L1-like esterase
LIYFKLLLLNTALLVLFPLLLAQGLWVRRRTLRLPEPDGERLFESPTFCEKSGVNVLVLGDSAAAGVGVTHQQHALSGLLYSALSNVGSARVVLLAKTGYTSEDVLNMLQNASVEKFNVALISVGVNDVTHFTSLRRWQQQCQQIQALLARKFQCNLIIFSELPPIHLFPAIVQPLRWVLGQRAKLFNQALQDVVCSQNAKGEASSVFLPLDIMYNPKNNDADVVVDAGANTHTNINANTQVNTESAKSPRSEIVTRFQDMKDSGFMATDGFHPSSKAYSLWVDRIMVVLNKQTWIKS